MKILTSRKFRADKSLNEFIELSLASIYSRLMLDLRPSKLFLQKKI